MPKTTKPKQKSSNKTINKRNQPSSTVKHKNKKRGKERLEVYISRIQNKTFPDSLNMKLTSYQTNFWKEKVFTTQNITYLSESSLQIKNKFYQNMMKETFGNHIIMNKYNETTGDFDTLGCEEVLRYLKNTLKKNYIIFEITKGSRKEMRKKQLLNLTRRTILNQVFIKVWNLYQTSLIFIQIMKLHQQC